jgi:hypothetical protein
MGGMTIGWIIIKFHESCMQRQALAAVATSLAEAPAGPITSDSATGKQPLDLETRINEEKGRIAASKTFAQRFFSIKALHGMIMFTSWINIVGRIFASNQSGDFTCHTYPVYKPSQIRQAWMWHHSRCCPHTTLIMPSCHGPSWAPQGGVQH